MGRDSPRTIGLRFNIITEWKIVGIDFMKNRVSIDEAGFYSHMMKSCMVKGCCRIHHSRFVIEAIKSRGYKPLFMPPYYSPFLNPIEERKPLGKEDQLTSHTAEACKTVIVKDCLGWISHSEKFWERGLQKEVGLK
ncbi:unnamed protein product [Cunninghamella echinulata]